MTCSQTSALYVLIKAGIRKEPVSSSLLSHQLYPLCYLGNSLAKAFV